MIDTLKPSKSSIYQFGRKRNKTDDLLASAGTSTDAESKVKSPNSVNQIQIVQ